LHNSTRHTASECREIKKLMEQFRKKMQQQRHDGTPSRQREGKQKVNSQEEKDTEMKFQDAKRALKAIYGHSNSESSNNEHCKTSMSCSEVPGPSRLGGLSRLCADAESNTAPQVGGNLDLVRLL
jgi:hypothetical protein